MKVNVILTVKGTIEIDDPGDWEEGFNQACQLHQELEQGQWTEELVRSGLVSVRHVEIADDGR